MTFNKWKLSKINNSTRKKILISSLATALFAGVVTPVICNVIIQNNDTNITSKYLFDGKEFDNKASLFGYAKEAAEVNNTTVRERDRWSIIANGETMYFNNISDLNNFVSSKIITHTAATSINLETGINGEINSSDYVHLNIDNLDSLVETNIYRGKDNTFYSSEIDAKDSYLQIHDAFMFDNTFFRTKEELTAYLNKNQDTIKTNDSNIVIVSPSNSYSQPIDTNNLSDPAVQKYITQFVNSNARQYVEFETKQNDQTIYKYFDREKIDGNFGNVLADFNDPAYVDVNSNEGKANYIIDSSVDDAHQLFGPYYAKSSASLKKITDKSLWRKIEGKDQGFIDNQKDTQIFSSFVDFVSSDSDDNTYGYPFSVGEEDNEYQIAINKYFSELSYTDGSVYNSVIELYNTMKKGKRYSSFYKLPILYIHTIEQLMATEASQDKIEATRNFYQMMAEYYDIKLKATVPAPLLVNSKSPSKTFSFAELYGLNKYNLDLNVDVEYYMDIVVEEFPILLQTADFVSICALTSANLLDIIKFDLNWVNRAFNKSFNASDKTTTESYQAIWNVVVNSNDESFVKQIKANAESNKIVLSNSIIDEMRSRYVLGNEIAIFNIESRIKSDLESLRAYNDPSKLFVNSLWDVSNSFFYKMSGAEVSIFLTLFERNLDTVSYEIFGLAKLYMDVDLAGFFNMEIGIFSPQYSSKILSKLIVKTAFTYKKIIESAITFGISTIVMKALFLFDPLGFDPDKWNVNPFSNGFLKTVIGVIGNVGKLEFKKLTEGFKNVADKFSGFFKCLPYASLAITFLEEFYGSEEYSYVFECEDTKYIWNGGKEETWAFGLITNNVSDIDDLKILPPMQVTQQHIENGRYYNGKIYTDDAQLKKDQLKDILNNRFNLSKVVKSKFSFSSIDSSLDVPSPLAFTTIEELTDYVFMNIKSSNSSFLTKNIYSYGNGFTFDPSNSVKYNIDSIINNIKATKIAIVPKLLAGKPISKDTTDDDNSLPFYQLPGKSWTPQNGFVVNNTSNQYVIVDSNYGEDEVQLSEKATIDLLKSVFYNAFEVRSKTILNVDLYKYSKFSDYKSTIRKMYVHEAILDNGYSKIFIDRGDAFGWIINQLNFTVYDNFKEISQYNFAGLTFNSLDDYLSWVLENTKEF